MYSPYRASRFSYPTARLLMVAVLAVFLLLISGGSARTDSGVSATVEPPNCQQRTPNTAIMAVYCAYNGSARFGKVETADESWNGTASRDRRQRFQFGTIYYVYQSRAAYALFNHVRDYYEDHQGELGKPITSEIGSADKGFCKAFSPGNGWSNVRASIIRIRYPGQCICQSW